MTAADFRALRKLKAATGNRFVGGVVFYDGLYAVPLRLLWEMS